MTRVKRSISFTETDVTEWCDQSNDSNDLHLSPEVAADSQFGERIVPGMMILDQVSGLVEQYGQTVGKAAILAGLVGCRFRDPISFNDTVNIAVEKVDEDNKFAYLSFEALVDGELAVHGTLSVILQ